MTAETDRIKALVALAEDHERIAASASDTIRGPDSMSPKDQARAANTIRAAFAASQPAPEVRPGAPITLTYTNWRGDTEVRRIIPRCVWWGSTEWHPEPQWLLTAFDVDKDVERDFALKDFGQPVASQPVQPVAWQRLVDGKWQNCSEFVALGFTGDAQKHDPDVRPLYATPQPITVQDAQPVAVTGALFIDGDGDVCINDGRENNLVFCPASDDDGKPLCPDVIAEIVGRFNAAPQPLTVQDEARVSEIAAERDAYKLRGNNHWETMRCIYRIATVEGDLNAIIQHIKDAGQGYTERPEETLRHYQTEVARLTSELHAALRAIAEGRA